MLPMRPRSFWGRLIAASTAYLFLTAQVSAIGIGFSLTLDYGVASVELSNGNSVDAARIEGSQAYKDMMRSSDIRDPIINDHASLPRPRGDFCGRWYHFQENILSPLICSIWEEPLKDMLSALKDSVAIHLPQTTKFPVVVVFPFPTSRLFRGSVRSIGSSLSLRILDQLSAAELVSIHREPPGCEGITMSPENMHDGYDLVLTIDHTRAALTAMMLAGWCHKYHPERVLHETSFGSDNMSKNTSHSRVALKHALQQLARLPMYCRDDNTRFDSIQRVLIFGDDSDDTVLHQVLGEVLDYDRRLRYQVLGHAYGPLWAIFQSAFDVAHYAAKSCARTVYRSELLAAGVHFNPPYYL